MRLTVSYDGVVRTFTEIKPSTCNLYITAMSDANHLGRRVVKVEDDRLEDISVRSERTPSLDEVLSKVRSLTESDHHAGEA